METRLILNVDKSSISDLLFVQRLGRYLAPQLRPGRSVIVVHDGHDAAEDVLDAMGYDSLSSLDASEIEAVAPRVFGAVRDKTRQVVASLTEEGIPAAGMQGADRGVVVQSGDRRECKNPDLLLKMTETGTVAVVGPISASTGGGQVLSDSLSTSVAIAQRLAQFEGEARTVLAVFSDEILSQLPEIMLNTAKTDSLDSKLGVSMAIRIRPNELANTEFWERFT